VTATASPDRIKKIVAGSKATVVIQHDARDVDKLPAFPASARVKTEGAAAPSAIAQYRQSDALN